jgi:hypothetical protein
MSVALADGEYTMTVELSPDQWTFGGGCFFGHGLNVSGGGARFIMTRFELK